MRHAIVGFAADNGASDSELEDIALAVSEALTNVVVGMRPRADSSGLGHGLSVINRITEQLRVEDAKPGVRMRMTFAIGWG